ncbi:MAG: helix-turn-helix transcriptional regulator [Angelakisella sp.]|nr:helix-turn-helix transcriptional regulator [Angelakisella sp.]
MKIYRYKGKSNIIGQQVALLRKRMIPTLTQKGLAEKLQLMGYDFDRLTIQRIEAGTRFVADYEVQALAKALGVEIAELFL